MSQPRTRVEGKVVVWELRPSVSFKLGGIQAAAKQAVDHAVAAKIPDVAQLKRSLAIAEVAGVTDESLKRPREALKDRLPSAAQQHSALVARSRADLLRKEYGMDATMFSKVLLLQRAINRLRRGIKKAAAQEDDDDEEDNANASHATAVAFFRKVRSSQERVCWVHT